MIAVTDAVAAKRFREAWQVPALPKAPSVALEESLDAGLTKGLFVQQANSLWEMDADKWKKLLGRLEFLAIADSSPGPAMELAQVVLPLACFGEQTGTIMNQEGTVLHLGRVFEPQGESLADWEILLRILAAQGLQAPDGLGAIQKEMRRLVPDWSRTGI
jgi:predicted molibdopterin-dependent oxidoreductase YjgC